MEKLIIKAPAKINLGLNIIEKRKDGYHNIETVFYPIRLYDELEIFKSDAFNFKCSNLFMKSDRSNSIIKAKNLLEDETGKKLNCIIYLKKNIPIGAGLGGGSSDAAATLKALKRLYDLKISTKKLTLLAEKIGSDVPFFIKAIPCYASKKGEKIKEMKITLPHPILIVNPGIHISTKWAYENIRPEKPETNLLSIFNSLDINFKIIKNSVRNDFEEIVFNKFPAIGKIKEQLYNYGAMFSLMTGSGSTVYGIFPDLKSAKNAGEKFNKNYFTFIHT